MKCRQEIMIFFFLVKKCSAEFFLKLMCGSDWGELEIRYDVTPSERSLIIITLNSIYMQNNFICMLVELDILYNHYYFQKVQACAIDLAE